MKTNDSDAGINDSKYKLLKIILSFLFLFILGISFRYLLMTENTNISMQKEIIIEEIAFNDARGGAYSLCSTTIDGKKIDFRCGQQCIVGRNALILDTKEVDRTDTYSLIICK